jgi:uncharacterized membrane protein (DUF2068 family)
MATLHASAPITRPAPVVAAVVLSVVLIIANFAGFFLPANGQSVPLIVIILSVVPGLAGIPAAIGLWQLRRWGYFLTLVVTAINAIAGLPGLPLGPTVAIKVFSVAMTLVSIVILVLVTLPDSRRSYQ